MARKPKKAKDRKKEKKTRKPIILRSPFMKHNTPNREGTVRADGMAPAFRNLHKGDLGGAIFCCDNRTLQECFDKKLFGHREIEYGWVQNVGRGLLLFLFNLTDRLLHGVYEATSIGRMRIDPHAWTPEGKGITQFPAQVRFQIKVPCMPLQEKNFRNIIKGNYTGPRYFWFELDKKQTASLCALFKESAISRPAPDSNRFALLGLYDVDDDKLEDRESEDPDKDREDEMARQMAQRMRTGQMDRRRNDRVVEEDGSNKGKEAQGSKLK